MQEPRAGDLWVDKTNADYVVFLVPQVGRDDVSAYFLNRYAPRIDNDPESNCPAHCEDFSTDTYRYIGRISSLFLSLEVKIVQAIGKGEI